MENLLKNPHDQYVKAIASGEIRDGKHYVEEGGHRHYFESYAKAAEYADWMLENAGIYLGITRVN